MALVDQKMGGRTGVANYVLYKLASNQSQYPAQCNGSNTAAIVNAACVFNDVTSGTNAVPGQTSTTQYSSTTGYDLASGLGSVNVNNLVGAWSAATFTGTQTALTLNPQTSIVHGSKVTVDITVTPLSGTAKPTGSVSLLANSDSPPKGGLAVDQLALNAGVVSSTTQLLPGGSNMITAHDPGDATFGASDSPAISVTVNPEPSTTAVTVLTADSGGHPIPFTNGPYGSFVYLRADVAGNSGFGTPTGSVNLSDNFGFLATETLNSAGNTSNTPSGSFSPPPGAHALIATYLGDLSFSPSTSPAANFTITKGATTTSIQPAANAVGIGGTLALNVTIATTSAGNAPSGPVVFFAGTAPLPGNAYVIAGPNSQSGYVQAIGFYQATNLSPGQNSITAQYGGDPNYAASTSPAVTINVIPDFSLAFTGSSPGAVTIAPGATGTLTLAVTGQPGYSGTVNFASTPCSGLPLYTTCSFSPPTVTGSGTTTITVKTTAPHIAFPQGGATARNLWVTTSGFTLAALFVLGFTPARRRWTSSASSCLPGC